jgi:prepilin-type N-terminal cleavage/methylation domain-containing protein
LEGNVVSQARRLRQEEGFTLIELLIVIAVMGILSTVVVISVNGINNRAKTETCNANKATIQTAAEAYYALNNTYPASAADIIGAGKLIPSPLPSGTTVTYSATAAPTVTC